MSLFSQFLALIFVSKKVVDSYSGNLWIISFLKVLSHVWHFSGKNRREPFRDFLSNYSLFQQQTLRHKQRRRLFMVVPEKKEDAS